MTFSPSFVAALLRAGLKAGLQFPLPTALAVMQLHYHNEPTFSMSG
jgi:hypothetical protein